MSTASGGISGKPSVKAKTSTPCRSNSGAIEKRFKVKLNKTDIHPTIYCAMRAKNLFRKEGTKHPTTSARHRKSLYSIDERIRLCTIWFIDVVLLPVEGVIRLNDDVLVSVLLEFIDEQGLARLERLGDFRMHAKGEIRAFVFGSDGHLARFGLNFIAERWDGLDHSGAGAIRARLAEHAFERLLGALAGDADESEFVEGQGLGGRLVLFESELQCGEDFFAV